MSSRRDFDITFVGLKPGIHDFTYDINDQFFTEYQEQDFTNCVAHIRLSLDKKSNFLLLKFEVGGKLNLPCDRCGNTRPFELWDEFNIVVKIVEDPDQMNSQEEDPDVYYISKGESILHIADWIYEFINLSIPMQRMCNEAEVGGIYCNKEVLEMIARLDAQKNKPESTLWKGLEKFKDLEN